MSRARRLLPRGFLAALALAASAYASIASPDAAVPEVRSQHEIACMSGGVENNGRDTMRAAARRLNVRLNVVSASTGEMLSGVDVSTADDRGKPRLRVHTEGPLLCMCLPHGCYQITVAYYDAMQTMSVSAGAQPVDTVVWSCTEPGSDGQLPCQRRYPCAGTRPTTR